MSSDCEGTAGGGHRADGHPPGEEVSERSAFLFLNQGDEALDGGKGQPRAGAVKHQGPGLCVLQPGLKTPGPRRAIQTGGPGSLALESSQRWPVHSGHTLRVPLSPPGRGMPAQSLDGGCLASTNRATQLS